MLAELVGTLVRGWMDKWVDRWQKLEERMVQWINGDKQMLETEMIVQTEAPREQQLYFVHCFISSLAHGRHSIKPGL